MSRLEISNHQAVGQHIIRLRKQALSDRHRALLIIHAPPVGYLQSLATRLDACFLSAADTADRADRISGMLGQEFGMLVHETADPVDAGLLAALTGTVVAGGLLILGLPFSLKRSETGSFNQTNSRFQQRLARLLLQSAQNHPGKIALIDGKSLPPASNEIDFPDAESTVKALIATDSHLPAWQSVDSAHMAAVTEQNELLFAAMEHFRQHPRGCLTITGRRGRGKSALMGRMACGFRQQGASVAMTAVRRTALKNAENQGIDIPFLAAADAVHSGHRVLLVDEAASLPIDTLTQYLHHHDHVIYCTTLEGYEQAGRAFDIRFTEVLQQQNRAVLAIQPTSAWRWAAHDPLEAFMDTLLLTEQAGTEASHAAALGAQPEAPGQQRPSTMEPRSSRTLPACDKPRRLDRDELVQNEALLAEVFALLRDSHYQTTASDIAHLLDAPNLQIWVLEEHRQISAALLLAIEGDIDASLHDTILGKQRRLPHQLLPQLLAQSANQSAPLKLCMGRVIRIAVIPDRRRQGLGSRLLQELATAQAMPKGTLAGIGASFAGDSTTIDFWKSNGFTVFHTGFRRNPRTGTQAAAVLNAFEPSLQESLQEAARIHDENQGWRRGTATARAMDSVDKALLSRFARSQRSFIDTYAALNLLARDYPLPLTAPDGLTRRQHETELRARVTLILQSSNQHLRNSS